MNTKTVTCKSEILNEFEVSVKEGMVTADILKKRDGLGRYALSTIKTTLSRLKKEGVLRIAFKTRGDHYLKGKCYYKLN